MFNNFYSGKTVLVTGHTGFKGGWLSLWLRKLGANNWGLSLPPERSPNLHEVIRHGTFAGELMYDINNLKQVAKAIKTVKPDLVFHLAAQPIVRRSYVEPLRTLQTNVMGTANVLEAVRQARLNCNVIVVTSDKCYNNKVKSLHTEDDPLGGTDVYSMSKASTELVAQAWQKSFFAPDSALGVVATVRAGNVIGGGDYAEDRIIPDCIRALMQKEPIQVRNPAMIRPWQHVLDCLSGYLWLGACLHKDPSLAGAFNFGPPDPVLDYYSCQPERAINYSVKNLVEETLKHWPGTWTDNTQKQMVESGFLALSSEKARSLLGWYPVWNFQEAVKATTSWYYERFAHRSDMQKYSLGQIDEYSKLAERKMLPWTDNKIIA